MDGIFGYMNGRFEVSLADSTMMWIVHYAMNRAQEKMKTKTGVIERLNEMSKFYELAVMQLEGCLSIVHAETESTFLESNHEEVLNDLREIKDRLQWRLKESELAILEKDKELTQRLENELQLKHALEVKARQLDSFGVSVSHGIETSNLNVDNDETTQNDHGNGDFCELRTRVDQQKLEPQHGMLSEVQVQQSGIGRKRVEEMDSDIDILKQTMDLAFGKMQSALFLCEMRPKERQWKLRIEKDVMSILIGSFLREFQENIEAERRDENQVLKVLKEHLPRFMNEFTSLQHELAVLHETCHEDSDCSSRSSPSKPSSPEGSHEIPHRFPQKVEEIDMEEKTPEDEENEDGSKYVAKLIKNHESIIRRKSEEMNWSKHGILQEVNTSSSRKKRVLNRVRERIHAVSQKLDNFIHRNAKLCESLFNQKAFHNKEPFSGRKLSEVNEIHTSKDVDNQGSSMEKVKGVSDAANIKQEELIFGCKSCNFDLEKQIQEHVHKCYLREVINEWNSHIEANTIERKIRDEINLIVLSEAVMDITGNQEFSLVKGQGEEAKEHCLQCSTSNNQLERTKTVSLESMYACLINEDVCMLIFRKTVDEFNKMMVGCEADSVIREHIHQIVFGETLKNFVNIASSASEENQENSIQNNFLDQLQFIIIESFLKEDVCMVVFKTMLKEWQLQLDNYCIENFIREKIHQVIMLEKLNDAFLLTMEVKSLVQDNTVEDNNTIEDNCSTMMLNQVQKVEGEENFTIILLESLHSCFEAEENLMLSAKSEIKEHSKQLDLGSERGDLHEHEIFEDLLTGEEQTFSSLTSKVENVLQQLGISKALLRKLGTSLGHSLCETQCFHNQMSTNEEGQLKLSFSTLLPLLNLVLTFAEFGAMICQKFEMMTTRLEKIKCCLDPVIELVGCLRNKELLYQKAFIRRSQNLQKAEAEVDLLGDQVDALLTLLEKIYVTLHQHAPALQQYFEVYDILELMKRELSSGAVQAASVVT
ncbi:WPP domain-associated protein [Abrus precatorius]|uniref:WPP domain-associated protein n=1 Tax=Abrus precatorius TaxID=3816 RepID=A0A8B8KRN5_ABRPR|nr:WPP domain-associated protein [Abrus precatorius]